MVSIQTNGYRKNRKGADENDQNCSTVEKIILGGHIEMAESAYPEIQKIKKGHDMKGHKKVYNIVSGKYNNQPAVKLNLSHVSNTSGSMYKLQLTHLHYNLRKHIFSNRTS